MTLVDGYRAAQAGEQDARMSKLMALRGMAASGMTQRQIAEQLGISQSAVSQQLQSSAEIDGLALERLLRVASATLKQLTQERGFQDLAVFGSVARNQSRRDSDIDLLVQPPEGTTIREMISLQGLLQKVLGRPVDLTSYGGLKPGIDDDVRAEAVPL